MAKVAGIALTTAVLAMILRPKNASLASILVMAGGGILLLMAWEPLMQMIKGMQTFSEKAGVETELLWCLRVMGVAFSCELAADLCRESGEEILSKRTVLTGRILLLAMAMPVLLRLWDVALQWLEY